jgi:GR25 family glycosyltransferase involved in LPS biosynthesis
MGMTIFCISCPNELPAAHEAAVSHFIERKVKAQFVNAIHSEKFGILSWRPYRKDHPKAGSLIDMAQVGLTLSHYMVWQICEHHSDDVFMILEDDCVFPEGWSERISDAMRDMPEDWGILLIGSSNTSDKEKSHIKGDIWEVKYPFCTHAMIIARKALPVLIEHCRDASKHIDILLHDEGYSRLKVYTLLPRLCEQRGNPLAV